MKMSVTKAVSLTVNKVKLQRNDEQLWTVVQPTSFEDLHGDTHSVDYETYEEAVKEKKLARVYLCTNLIGINWNVENTILEKYNGMEVNDIPSIQEILKDAVSTHQNLEVQL